MAAGIRSFVVLMVAGLLTTVGVAAAQTPDAGRPDTPRAAAADTAPRGGKIGKDVLEALRAGEEPEVVIALDIGVPPRNLGALRREVAAAQRGALNRVSRSELRVKRQYTAVPALSAIARSENGLRRMAADPRVRRIDLDLAGTGTLADSVPLIRADLRQTRGNDGTGVTVAVLDTGFDSDHPDLAGALQDEACFGDNNGAIDGTGFCPNGSDRQTGAGAAEDDAGHGTHVSGIITSDGVDASVGVAPGAGIVAIKVLNNCSFSGCFSAFSEVVAGLDYIIDNPGLGVDVVNMSLGTNALFTGDCDNASAAAMSAATAVGTLNTNGVTVFASAGNNGSGTQMPLPACVADVISVGATDDNDNVIALSNSNGSTDIFAPGNGIVSSGMGGGTATATGTSMASPHAAACAALLIESGDATTPAAIETRLETSDVQVTDATNSLTFPRIDCAPDSNQPPVVTADNATVTVDEGSVATNTGTVSDPDGDDFTLTTTVGTVVDNGDGTWSWSFGAGDGPGDSQTVTITATDSLDDDGSAAFNLTVNNVPPDVDAGPDASILSNEVFSFSGSFSDPGIVDFRWDWTIDWGDTQQTIGSTNDQAAPILAGHQFCGAGTYTIALGVTDKDGGTGSDAMELTVEHVAVPVDVKPRDPGTSPISMSSRGRIPVAVLSTADFDATTVDPATVTLGDGTGPGTGVAKRPNGTLFAATEDVNRDGLLDLMMQFETQELVANGDLNATTTTLFVEGFLTDGCTNVLGSENVTVVP